MKLPAIYKTPKTEQRAKDNRRAITLRMRLAGLNREMKLRTSPVKPAATAKKNSLNQNQRLKNPKKRQKPNPSS